MTVNEGLRVEEKGNEMRKIIATGYELELLNSMVEKVSQLYEFPPDTKEVLVKVSNAIQEQATALDVIDSIQTSCGPLRRTFSEQDLVILHSLVVNALDQLSTQTRDRVDEAIHNLTEARKMLEHPDTIQEGGMK